MGERKKIGNGCGHGHVPTIILCFRSLDTVVSVRPDSLLTLHYRLSAPDGPDWVNTFGHRPATLTLGAHQLAPALEACLLGLEEGAHAHFELPPDTAFGAHDPARVQRISRAALQNHLPDDVHIAVGDAVQLSGVTSASGASAAATVTAVSDDMVELDFNHPLAGKPVVFDVHILGVL
ncbi:MAG: FKBP-type peptidyl-prolyl cis-trans isomerase [Betaproteobacteria bacterium]|nr:FKBP-type peptidyl-prolyl cis-trans isomerase [Betaproteobacteria bacterium]